MKATPGFAVLSLLSTFTAAVVLPEPAFGPLTERDDFIATVNSTAAGNSTVDPDCQQGCGTPKNYERWGVRLPRPHRILAGERSTCAPLS